MRALFEDCPLQEAVDIQDLIARLPTEWDEVHAYWGQVAYPYQGKTWTGEMWLVQFTREIDDGKRALFFQDTISPSQCRTLLDREDLFAQWINSLRSHFKLGADMLDAAETAETVSG
jgi:hypothetical protein